MPPPRLSGDPDLRGATVLLLVLLALETWSSVKVLLASWKLPVRIETDTYA